MLLRTGRGFAPLATRRIMTFSFLNALPAAAVYTRADTVATYRDSGGKLRIAASNTPRFDYTAAGIPLGLLIEGSIQNKFTGHAATPPNTTGFAVSGTAAITLLADAAAITAAGLENVVTGNVYQITGGASGGAVTLPGTTGNTSAHSFSVFARVSAGASGALTHTGTSPGSAAITGAGYSRFKLENQTISGAGVQMQITAPANTTILFILPQIEQNPFCTSPVITAGAAATRQQDNITIDNLNTKTWWNEKSGAVALRYISMGDIAATQYLFAATDGANFNEAVALRVDSTGYDLKSDIRSANVSISSGDTGTAHSAGRVTFAGLGWQSGASLIMGQGDNDPRSYSGGANGTTRLTIGARNAGTSRFWGWIQEIRISKKYPAPAALAAMARRSTDTVILAGGQSLATGHFVSQSTLLDSGRQKFIEIINNARPADAVTLVDGSTGSSAACKTSNATNFWWDNATNTRGPALNSFYAAQTANGLIPKFILWAQGEEDSHQIGIGTTRAQYKSALQAIFADMRAAFGPVAVIIQRIGRRTSGYSNGANRGVQTVREVQQEMIDETPWVLAGAEVYDQPLVDGVHLTAAGYAAAAERSARRLLQHMGVIASGATGPRITAAARTGSTITVTITHDGGTDFAPSSSIEGFRYLDGGGANIAISAAVRTNATTITLTLASAVSGTLYYAFDDMAGLSTANVVRDNAAISMPLRSTKRTVG